MLHALKSCRAAFPDQVEIRQPVEELVAVTNSSESSIATTLSAFPEIAASWRCTVSVGCVWDHNVVAREADPSRG